MPSKWQVKINAPGQSEEDTVPEEPIAKPGGEKSEKEDEAEHGSPSDDPTPFGLDAEGMTQSADDQETQVDDLPWQSLDSLLMPEDLSEGDNLTLDEGVESHGDHVNANRKEKFWQPLESQVPGGEDLASILHGDYGNEHIEQMAEGQHKIETSVPERLVAGSPSWASEETKPVSREIAQPSLAETVFDVTFYLVPRLQHHYLLGELALWLRKWILGLCDDYGWQLEFIAVRPDYLKWTLGDFPECLCGEMLAVVRRVTSERIFRVFPALQSGNPTQDYWSPGYLVDILSHDFPTQVVIAKVTNVRSGEK